MGQAWRSPPEGWEKAKEERGGVVLTSPGHEPGRGIIHLRGRKKHTAKRPRKATPYKVSRRKKPQSSQITLVELGFLLEHERFPNVLGAYSHENRLICTARSKSLLIRKLKKCKEKGLRGPIHMVPAKSERDLPAIHYQSRFSDAEYLEMKSQGYAVVMEAKRRGDKQYLDELASEIRISGERGDKATDHENRQMIEVLHELATNKSATVKGQVPDSAQDVGRASRSLSTRLRRFCLRAHSTWKELACPRPEWWHRERVANPFYGDCGFVLPRDEQAAREAIKRGKKYYKRLRERQAESPRHSMRKYRKGRQNFPAFPRPS